MTTSHGPAHSADTPGTDHHSRHTHAHGAHATDHGHSDADMAELLELDAAVTGAYLDEVIASINSSLTRRPSLIVDAGAGTGAGTRALAAAFPDADVVAVDSSARMTARIESDRIPNVDTVTADFTLGWPAAVGPADVLWISAALHHMADPDAFLLQAFAHTQPGGVLAVIEMPHQPRFCGTGLDDRVEAIMRAQGANSFPDWTEAITAAGFTMRSTHTVRIDIANPTDVIRRYAQAWFTRVRASLAEHLDADEREIIDDLLGDGPGSFSRRATIPLSAARTIWIANR